LRINLKLFHLPTKTNITKKISEINKKLTKKYELTEVEKRCCYISNLNRLLTDIIKENDSIKATKGNCIIFKANLDYTCQNSGSTLLGINLINSGNYSTQKDSDIFFLSIFDQKDTKVNILKYCEGINLSNRKMMVDGIEYLIYFIWTSDLAALQQVYNEINLKAMFCLECEIPFCDRCEYTKKYKIRTNLENLFNINYLNYCYLHLQQRTMQKIIDEIIQNNEKRLEKFNSLILKHIPDLKFKVELKGSKDEVESMINPEIKTSKIILIK